MTGDHLPEPEPRYTPGAQRVLDAASDLFYREGIHAVGVDSIAQAAGVTKKTLYDRFGSKEALVVAYLRGRDSRWREYLESELEALPAGPGRVGALFDISRAWADLHGARGCSAINARAEVESPADPIAHEAIRQKKWLRDIFERECRAAGLADPGPLADALMLLYEGALVTTGMGTFADPFGVARESAQLLISRG